MRRLPIIVPFALGLVALLGAGTGTFAAVRGMRGGTGPTKCGYQQCVPTLRSDRVVAALESRGYACQEESYVQCSITLGTSYFGIHLGVADGLISEYEATSRWADDGPPSKAAESHLVWAASLPFGDDPAFAAEIKKWLLNQVEEGRSANAKVGNYTYEVTVRKSDDTSASVRVRGDS